VTLPEANPSPPFEVTRLSHVVLNVRSLSASRRFYEEIVGLVVTAADEQAMYLRGVEEVCHHSLILRASPADSTAERVGFRVRTDRDLDSAARFFESQGRALAWADVPYHGRTLLIADDAHTPLELCAHMETQRREILRFDRFNGAAATRIDHVQVHVPDVGNAASFYGNLGFRVSEYASQDGTPDAPLRSIFMARKGNANDIVLASNTGPRLHHSAFVVHDASTVLPRVCDLAASLGLRDSIEWGPHRHGLGAEQFLYLRDPDGNRVELLSPPYQLIDLDDTPYGWATTDRDVANTWGPPAPESWRGEASLFRGVATTPPAMPNSSAHTPTA
jgi:catechol 2,3-dioxygenase